MKGCVSMSLFTFKKGLHLPYNKELTKDKSIEIFKPKKELIFPLSQHIGAPCEPIVEVGQKVLVNEKIADSSAFISAPVHSSVSGTIKDIREIQSINGSTTQAIIIENDSKYEKSPRENLKYSSELSLKDVVKLNVKEDKEIKYIIINAAECEPYLTCDHRVMLEYTEEIIGGLRILLELFPKALIYIGIEDNKLNAIDKFKRILGEDNKIKVMPLKSKYPQGSEKHLIYTLTKLQVPSGKLPLDIGCIVFNVSTIYQLYASLINGLPLTERIITVTGDSIRFPKNLRVKIGTPVKDIIEFCGGFVNKPNKIILGGPMMGTSINSLDLPITKGTSGILCLSKVDDFPNSHCIRCGKCLNSCPMNLIPQKLNELALKDKLDEFEFLGGMDCLECGCCTFSCPAKISIVNNIRNAKKSLRNKSKKNLLGCYEKIA